VSTTDAPRLTRTRKAVFALGDHTVNIVLSAASLLYLFFLTNVAGMRPALAAAVVWVARAVDAFTDPTMGRISDLTRIRGERRRPYFLLGALPFGIFFALMWQVPESMGQTGLFVYYATVYVGVSLSMTCVSVPYLALIPEMATGYDERTSLNTYRGAAAVLGTLAAVVMKLVVERMGGTPGAWEIVAVGMAVWLVLPWIFVFAVSFERPGYQRESQIGFREGARILARHRNYRVLTGFYILARIAVDLIGAMFIYYFAVWLRREEDFVPTMGTFLVLVVACLPVWRKIAEHRDKKDIFIVGCAWWLVVQLVIVVGSPEWPRWTMVAIASLAAIGYAVADLMPWAMLGDVVDEDEVATGERREGMYVGFFMFIRKLGGATAVAAIGVALDLVGYDGKLPAADQPDAAVTAVRILTGLVPAIFLALAIKVAMGYSLTRDAHQQILDAIKARTASH
jgi:sugar (glycoside-pentoside-hexuronide) transporter